MSVFKRTKDILASSVNSLLDKAEDPVKLLNQYMIDLGKDITKAETQVAKQIATTKRLENQVREAENMIHKRTSQAQEAVDIGNEDLARRALEDKQGWESKLEAYLPAYEQNSQVSEQLKVQLFDMKEKYREMQSKRHELEARASAAKATKSMNQSMSGFGTNNAAKGFERMENRVAEWEAQASASMDMNSVREKSLDEELASLGVSGVDRELEAMKAQRLNLNTEEQVEQQPSQNNSTKSSIDDELEALKKKNRHE